MGDRANSESVPLVQEVWIEGRSSSQRHGCSAAPREYRKRMYLTRTCYGSVVNRFAFVIVCRAGFLPVFLAYLGYPEHLQDADH